MLVPCAPRRSVFDALQRLYTSTVHSVDQTYGTVDGVSPEVTTSVFDPNGNVAYTLDALHAKTAFTHNGPGWETSVTLPSQTATYTAGGPQTLYFYDGDGNVTTERSPTHNTTYASTTIDTDYSYDYAGRLVSVTLPDPDGSTTTLHSPVTRDAYDAAGLLLHQTETDFGDSFENITSYFYNALGQQTSVVQPNPINGNGVASAGASGHGPETDTVYDGDGNAIKVTDPNGNVTYFTFNYLDQMIQMTQPASGNSSDQHSLTTPITYYTYNNLGDLLSVEDPNGVTTSYTINALGEQIAVITPNPATGNGTVSTSTRYASWGGVMTQVGVPFESFATTDLTTYNTYDGFHRLATQQAPNNDSSHVTSFGYDRDGQQTGETDPDGNTTSWQYNLDGQLKQMTDPLSVSQYYYYNLTTDPAGDLTSTTDRNTQTTEYAYDNLGRQISETGDGGGTTVGTTHNDFVIATAYDEQGNVYTASQTDQGSTSNPSNLTYTYSHYDALHRLTEVDETFSSSTGLPAINFYMGYDDDGNRTSLSSEVDGNADFVNTYAYDALNMLQSVTQEASRA